MQVCTSLQTDNHANTPPLSFFTGRMPFLPPNQQRQSTEGQAQAATFTEIECSLISAMSDAQRLILSQTASQTKPVQNYHQHISSA